MFRLFFVIWFCFSSALFSESFVTYEFSGGRFGDCVLTYLHAKWLSYKYQIPLLYKPFDYSSELVLHKEERFYYPIYLVKYPIVRLNRDIPVPEQNDCIYECPYFSTRAENEFENPGAYRFAIDWKDKEFKKLARELIAPIKPLKLTVPPKNRVNLAVHIREGGGIEKGLYHFPLKLPPLSFYLEAFPKVLEEFRGFPIYCYLFTDALEPAKLALELQKVVPPGISVEIRFRHKDNYHASNVLEDFFSFFQFDALIYPHSNYSLIPAMMGDFAVTYYPLEFVRDKKKVTITKSALEKDETLYEQVLERVKKG